MAQPRNRAERATASLLGSRRASRAGARSLPTLERMSIMVTKPITLKQLVDWNALVFGLSLVALVGVGVAFFLLPFSGPEQPYVDLTSYMHSSADETRRLVRDCVHNEHAIWLSLSTSRVPATVALGVLGAVSLLTGLSTLFAFLVHRRLSKSGLA